MKNINKDILNDIINTARKILKISYILIIVIGSYVLLKIIKELKILDFAINLLKILAPLFLGIVIAWLLNPFIKWLETKKVRRFIGSIFAYIILLACIFLLIKSIIPLLYNQTIELVENFPNIFSRLKLWISELLEKFGSSTKDIETTLLSRLDSYSVKLSESLPSLLINGVSGIVSKIGTFVVGLVIGFFLLLSCNNLGSTLLEMVPNKFKNGTEELCKKIEQTLRNYVNGALLDAFVVFVVSTISFAIIGLKAPILFGLFCGLMNVIPYAGPYIGGAPAVIVGFSQSFGLGITILIAIIIIQTIEGNFIQAVIMSKTTKLNPVTIIIGLLVFGHFFGIVGMLLSTPTIGVFKVIIKYFDEKYDLLNFN